MPPVGQDSYSHGRLSERSDFPGRGCRQKPINQTSGESGRAGDRLSKLDSGARAGPVVPHADHGAPDEGRLPTASSQMIAKRVRRDLAMVEVPAWSTARSPVGGPEERIAEALSPPTAFRLRQVARRAGRVGLAAHRGRPRQGWYRWRIGLDRAAVKMMSAVHIKTYKAVERLPKAVQNRLAHIAMVHSLCSLRDF